MQNVLSHSEAGWLVLGGKEVHVRVRVGQLFFCEGTVKVEQYEC